ncbi:unnamed protein product [Auanema sp. JU1783]|nr:unnamed protein product [Auanema sp. JU1783]
MVRKLVLHLTLLTSLAFGVEVDIKNDKCLQCQFLVDTFQAGLLKTSRHHFAGGDTAWEEKNLGKYSTSETRLIEIMEGICKKRSLSNTDKYNGITDLEFKCSALLEDNEETVESYYYNHQDFNMSGWLCVEQLKICCPDGHFGTECTKCPGLEVGAFACFGHGKCHGDGSRKGAGKCKCDAGYVGHMCRHCDADYYEEVKTEASVKCTKCFDGCSGGCGGPNPKDCNRCRTGYTQDPESGCIDVNECLSETSPCKGENEECSNNIGSFTCSCKEGYKRNSETNVCELDIEAVVQEPSNIEAETEEESDGKDEL